MQLKQGELSHVSKLTNLKRLNLYSVRVNTELLATIGYCTFIHRKAISSACTPLRSWKNNHTNYPIMNYLSITSMVGILKGLKQVGMFWFSGVCIPCKIINTLNFIIQYNARHKFCRIFSRICRPAGYLRKQDSPVKSRTVGNYAMTQMFIAI